MPKLTKTYDARLMLKLESELLERIQSTAGPGKVNDWLRQAAREKLDRDRRPSWIGVDPATEPVTTINGP